MVFLLYQMIIYLKKQIISEILMKDRMGILMTTKPPHIKDEEKAYKDKIDKDTIGAFEQVPTQSAHIDLID